MPEAEREGDGFHALGREQHRARAAQPLLEQPPLGRALELLVEASPELPGGDAQTTGERVDAVSAGCAQRAQAVEIQGRSSAQDERSLQGPFRVLFALAQR